MSGISSIVNRVRGAVLPSTQWKALRRLAPLSQDAVIANTIERFQAQPGWALHLPEDPATIHLGDSEKAARFQRGLSDTEQFGGWSTSHMCIQYTMCQIRFALPRSYLEIGVNEGLSLFTVITSLRYQSLLMQTTLPSGILLDDLVLADMWGNQYGGTGKGTHQHIRRILKSLDIDLDQTTFLDGDSKQTIPAYFSAGGARRSFDAVYVDGDHSYLGAKTDLENVLPHVGKVLFFDDIYHPAHALNDRLLDLHKSMVERLRKDFYVFLNRRWFGFAVFIRKDFFDTLPI